MQDSDFDELMNQLPIKLRMEDPFPNMVEIVKDDAVEDVLLRNTQLMDEFFINAKAFNFKKFERETLTDDYLKRFDDYLPNLKHSSRKRMIRKLLKEHPSLRTVDPELLYQRFGLFYKAYGKKAEKVDPRPENPLTTVAQALSDIYE